MTKSIHSFIMYVTPHLSLDPTVDRPCLPVSRSTSHDLRSLGLLLSGRTYVLMEILGASSPHRPKVKKASKYDYKRWHKKTTLFD